MDEKDERIEQLESEIDAARAKRLINAYRCAPPIVQAAIIALLKFEEKIDHMGYDIHYYQEDLPKVVQEAILPWAKM